MKKQISILLSLLLVFSSLIVSCDDGSGDLDSNICKITVSSSGNGSVSITNNTGTSVNVLLGSDVEVVATPDEGCEFLGWFVGEAEEPVSTSEKFMFIVSENTTLVAKFNKLFEATGSIGGYDYVDLDLPSGVKWANFNVGATAPWEFGGYYAYGEIEEKEDYSWETYKWCNGSRDTMTKYCTGSDFGTVDNRTVLDPEDDVAHVKWGGDWRMPTNDECQELRDNCTWEWTTVNGVNGYKVTGSNGNCIFFPAAGYRYLTRIDYVASDGKYWSSCLVDSGSDDAFYMNFSGTSRYVDRSSRYCGRSIRPVCK